MATSSGAAAARQAAAGYALRAPPSAACRAIKTYTTSWDINSAAIAEVQAELPQDFSPRVRDAIVGGLEQAV